MEINLTTEFLIIFYMIQFLLHKHQVGRHSKTSILVHSTYHRNNGISLVIITIYIGDRMTVLKNLWGMHQSVTDETSSWFCIYLPDKI